MALAIKQICRTLDQNQQLKMNTRNLRPLTFKKGGKKAYTGERLHLQQMMQGSWMSICRKMKLGLCLSPLTNLSPNRAKT